MKNMPRMFLAKRIGRREKLERLLLGMVLYIDGRLPLSIVIYQL